MIEFDNDNFDGFEDNDFAGALLFWALIVSTVCQFFACSPVPGDEETLLVLEARTEKLLKAGSGVIVEPGVAVTACHVVEGVEFTTTRTWADGLRVELATPWECVEGRDVAVARLAEPEAYELAKVGDFRGFSGKGCILGRVGKDHKLNERCGTIIQRANGQVVLTGKNAREGMSGGPCSVDGVVVGVLSKGWQPSGGEHENTIGLAICEPIRKGDLK